ncbi:zinc ribbon domain-containing protein [Bacillus sp. CLL-7-23]|uniref:Zinc ribbon domain-containing protein n=1 Tax=Bacillus changyiensis TaxID=3004103 RepID=A0ABT4X6C5_9BACI|nr:zinc ribbon domain-containing protein [Bacillus changyiensis]MDA7027841.1 zinc ribbon domain-containing protein [Bacillus changyiensis]
MNQLFCQSCGMPMNEELFGTEADGSKNHEYCLYCYEKGAFKQPEATLEDMINLCVPYVKEAGKSETEARTLLESTLPHLKRWNSAEKTEGQTK